MLLGTTGGLDLFISFSTKDKTCRMENGGNAECRMESSSQMPNAKYHLGLVFLLDIHPLLLAKLQNGEKHSNGQMPEDPSFTFTSSAFFRTLRL